MRFPIRFPTAVLAGFAVLAGLGVPGCAPPQQQTAEPPVTVLIVRHAEKAAEPADDPLLTEAGRRRAALLKSIAGSSQASAVYATQYLRTQQTVEPLAEAIGLTVQQREAADVDGLAGQIFAENRGQLVVVAGHSNTVPMLVEKLTGKPAPPIEETEYDNLYVVTASSPGQGTAVRLRYGESDAGAAPPPE